MKTRKLDFCIWPSLSQKQGFYLIWGFIFSTVGALPGKDPGGTPIHHLQGVDSKYCSIEVMLGSFC